MSFEQRRQDTRRKIALGGLVIKAGLEHEEPAVILGALVSAAKVLAAANGEENRARWRERGDLAFKAG